MHSGTASGVINGQLAGYSVVITEENKCLRVLEIFEKALIYALSFQGFYWSISF